MDDACDDEVADILLQYQAGSLDFEDARDALLLLDGGAAAEVLRAAGDPAQRRVHDVCVMVLADLMYPPAFSLFRRLLDHDDQEAMAIPAGFAIDDALGGGHGSKKLYDMGDEAAAETLAAIAAAWDAAPATLPSEAEWLAARRSKQRAQREQVPPPSPSLSNADHEALRPLVIELKQAFDRIKARDAHALQALERRALARVVRIYQAHAPGDARIDDALAIVDRFLAGDAPDDALTKADQLARDATNDANAAAGWNPVHHRYMAPAARAAACVAQGALYLCSAEARNLLQTMHNARDALEWSGAGRAAVEAELRWQLAETRRLDGDSPAPAPPAPAPAKRRWWWPWSRRAS